MPMCLAFYWVPTVSAVVKEWMIGRVLTLTFANPWVFAVTYYRYSPLENKGEIRSVPKNIHSPDVHFSTSFFSRGLASLWKLPSFTGKIEILYIPYILIVFVPSHSDTEEDSNDSACIYEGGRAAQLSKDTNQSSRKYELFIASLFHELKYFDRKIR